MNKRKASEAYLEKLRDPRWQKKRLQILERDNWQCRSCSDTTKTLHVHHRWYSRGVEPWEYQNDALVTLCENCHEFETATRRESEEHLIASAKKTLMSQDVDAFAEVLLDINKHGLIKDFIDALCIAALNPEIAHRMIEVAHNHHANRGVQ